VYGPTLAFVIIFPLLGLLSFVLNPFWLKLKILQFQKRNQKYGRGDKLVDAAQEDGAETKKTL
jgi:hypothetical protein